MSLRMKLRVKSIDFETSVSKKGTVFPGFTKMDRSQPSEGVRSSDFDSGRFWDSFLDSENFGLIQYGLLSRITD